MTWWETQKEDWSKMDFYDKGNFFVGLSLCIMGVLGIIAMIWG